MVTESSPRFVARCDDCGVSKTYHTELGVNYFEDMHEGHTMIIEDALEEPRFEKELVETVDEEGPAAEVVQVLNNINELARKVDQPLTEVKQENKEPLPEETQTNAVSEVVADLPNPAEEIHGNVSVVRVTTAQEDPAVEEEPCILLSKFSFVKEGEKYARESIRVSQALSEFRWKIEPPYVISALFDENLGIESNTGSIGRDLLSKVEEIGYRFVAMESPKGVPTAWFRKEN